MSVLIPPNATGPSYQPPKGVRVKLPVSTIRALESGVLLRDDVLNDSAVRVSTGLVTGRPLAELWAQENDMVLEIVGGSAGWQIST